MTRVKRLREDETIPVRFTDRERELILDETFLDGKLRARFQSATAETERFTVPLTLYDLDELIGYVAAEYNHAKSRSLEKELGRLLDRLHEIDETHALDE